MKKELIRKLTSRKFWVALIGFITPLIVAFGVSETQAAQIAGIIMSGASAVAYIIGEGLVDSQQSGGQGGE
ncbi:MAG: hypothetical protein IKY44_06210 [Clostridia bacterium]|nr:hypothetical protein [Clostridia bacterium]